MVADPRARGAQASSGFHEERRGRQTRTNLVWNFATGILNTVGLLVLYPLAVRGAGTSAYGLWVVCFALIQLLVLTDLGIGTGVVRGVAIARVTGEDDQIRRVVSLGLTLFVALALILGAAMGALLPVYLHSLHLAPAVRGHVGPLVAIATAALVLGVVGRGATSVLWGDNRFDIERKWQMFGLTLRAVGIAICAVARPGVITVAVVEASTLVLPGLASTVIAVRWHRPRLVGPAIVWTQGIELLQFSLKVFAGAFSVLLAMQAPVYIAASYLPLIAVTALGAWTRVLQGGRIILTWLANPFLATTAAATTTSAPTAFAVAPDLARTHRRLLGGSLAMAGAMATPLLVAPGELSGAWLGPDFTFSRSAFRWIGLALFAMAISVPGYVLASAGGRPGRVAAVNVAWLVVSCIALLAVRSRHSLDAVVLASTIPLAALTPAFLTESQKVSGLRWRASDATSVLRGAVVLAIAGVALRVAVAGHVDKPRVAGGLVAYAVALVAAGAGLYWSQVRSRLTRRAAAST